MEEKRKPRSFSEKRETGYGKRETGRGKPKAEGGRPKIESGRRKPEDRADKGEWRKDKGERRGERGGKGENERPRATRRGDREGRPYTRTDNYQPKERNTEERRDRKFSAQKPESGERRGRNFSTQRPEGEERRGRSFSAKSETGERKGRSFSTQKPESGERRGRSFSAPRPEGEERRGRSFSASRREGTEGRKPKTEGRKWDADRKPHTSNRPPYTSDDRPPRKRRDVTAESEILTEIVELRRREGRSSPKKTKILSLEHEEKYGPIRLNKYIANSGICSRRDADTLIQTGAIEVNGQIVTELGAKVMPTDEVRFGDRILQREKPVYLLLNKPKDYITTVEDERDRKHVMQLIKGACKERIYPVGRLDKNTTGLLLFTNDGEMTKKLTHPKHNIRKIYYVELNKNLTAADFEKIADGIELSDGEIKVDEIAYAGETKREIGITLHSGRNRIVRRIFEQLGYEVEKLDRVVFAGLTKKDLPRGTYRFLSDAEINILKMIK
ncbi:MAG: pseudouridine synthase [Bacteroidetes bacterium]|nr:pseudouridine synthase [Bacteroidota bacterium]MCL2302081.1 pseudouridine synthase [Lentimicrobiaceae bacterium]